MSDKNGRERFFEKSFLLTEVKPKIVLEMSFLTISNADINFQARDLQQRFYTIEDILSTTRRVKLIGKKEFTTATLNPKYEAFIVHTAALNIYSGNKVYPLRMAQIAHLKADEAPIKVPSKYADFADVFSSKLAAELPGHRISNHVIELMDD